MATELDLYCDIQAHKLVNGITDMGAFSLGKKLHQGDTLAIKCWPLKPNYPLASSASYFSKVDIQNLSLKIAIGAKAGDEDLVAAQYTWNKRYDADATTGHFYADLSLNTTELNAKFGADTLEHSTYFVILLNEDGAWRTVYEQHIQIQAAVVAPTGESDLPSPVNEYLTRAECLEMFVKWINNGAGKNAQFTSPDGSRLLELGVGDDGEMITDIL